MIHRKSEMNAELKSNVRSGNGSPEFRYLFSQEELGDRASLFAVITLQPGESVGRHPHDTNGEAYLVLSGKVMVEEDGVEHELQVGDAEFCADGHTHAIRNHTDEVASFLALIINDR